jgi:hypothetical protein
MAYTATVMAWGLGEYEGGYISAGMYIVVMVKVFIQNVQFGR